MSWSDTEKNKLRRENEQLKEQLAALERLQAQNGAEVDRMRGSSAVALLLAADRTQRERELIEENNRLREANRRLQAEGPALERDKLIVELRSRLEAAKRVAEAAAKYIHFDGEPDDSYQIWLAVEAAVLEYRALTEPPVSPGKAAVIRKACDRPDEEWEALAEKQK